MLSYISIMVGGALGTGARFWLSGIVASRYGEVFPLGTLVVNVTGCFFVGALAVWSDPAGRFLVSPHLRQFFLIGLCGGYTTFSSFGLQTLDLAQTDDWWKAVLNAGASLVLCLLAVWLGRVTAIALISR